MGYLANRQESDYRLQEAALNGTSDLPGPSVLQGSLTSLGKGLVNVAESIGSTAQTIFGPTTHMFDPTSPDNPLGLANGLSPPDSNAPMSLSVVPSNASPNIGVGTQPITDAMANADTSNMPGFTGGVVNFQNAVQSNVSSANEVVRQWGETALDPNQTGVVGRTIAGTTEGLAKAVIGNAVAGPWGAAALLGGTTANDVYNTSIASGTNHATAEERAGLSGVLAAATAFLPIKFGKSMLTSVVGGSALSLATGAADRGLTSAILDANGYHTQAAQYRVFDGEAIAADAILGAAFGVYGHFAHPSGHVQDRVNPADIDAALAVAAENHFNRSSPGIPIDPEIANLHADQLTSALDAMARGDLPDIDPEVAKKIVDGVVPDPIYDTGELMQESAMREVPGYEALTTPIGQLEMPFDMPPEVAASKPQEPSMSTAEQGAPLDPIHSDIMDNLLARYPDTQIPQEDGTVLTVKQMADQMDAERASLGTEAKLHEIAAACAIRLGVVSVTGVAP